MLKEFNEDLSSIKMIQSEMKDTLIEIKNNFQEQHRSGWSQESNQWFECKGEKDIQSEQKEEKRIQKIEDSVRRAWDNF